MNTLNTGMIRIHLFALRKKAAGHHRAGSSDMIVVCIYLHTGCFISIDAGDYSERTREGEEMSRRHKYLSLISC